MWAAAAAFVLVAMNLRIVIAAVPPVLGDIQRGSGLSAGEAGLLITIPVVCFGACAFAAPLLTRRFGRRRLLWLAIAVIIAGVAVRLEPSAPALFAGTLIAGAAIAVGNVLMPGVIKQDFAGRAGLLTGLYSTALFVGPALSAGLTVPLLAATGLGWREGLAIWGIPALLALAAWAPQALRPDNDAPGGPPAPGADPAVPSLRALFRDPVAWAVTGFMGLQALGYYSLLTWLPSIFADHGMAAGQAGWMLSFSSFPGVAAALATPMIERRARRPMLVVAAGIGLTAVGYLGILADPVPLAYAWMTLLGLGQGVSLSLALGFIVARSPDHVHTGQLSTMAQGAGYLIACLGPLGLGLLHSVAGGVGDGWTVPVLALTALLVLQLAAGLQASRDRHVLDGGGVKPRPVPRDRGALTGREPARSRGRAPRGR